METKVKTKALWILSILFCIVLFSVMFFAFTGVTGNAYALNENDGTYFANDINFATNGKTSGFDSFHGACTGLVAWILAMV